MLRLALFAVASLAQDPPAADPPCALVGRLVDEAGAPLAGVTLHTSGWEANSDRVRAFGRPTGWSNPAPVETDAEGRFRVAFVPPRAYQFTLSASAAGRGGASWRWSSVAPGAELDLGTTVLEPEALITGFIVDGAGQLLTEGWRVSAYHNWNSGIDGRSSVGANAQVDPQTGEFRITGLPPGRIRIDASAGSIRIPERWVETKAGEATQVELRYDGPDPRRKLVVSISTRPFHPFRPEPGTVHAVGPDGVRFALAPEPGRANDWYAPDVRPGTYRVEIRDPRFLAWTQDAVPTGQAARVRLEGSAALVVRVVDGDSGAPVDAYALDVGYRNVNFSPNVFRVREASAAAPAGARYTGIVPGDLTLEVQAEGWPRAALAVDQLGPGETREVEVRLVRATPLVGRVVDHAGRPLAGIEVQITRGEVPGHDEPAGGTRHTSGSAFGRSFSVQIGYRDAAAVTAADGSFTFEGRGAGPHTLFAPLGRFCEASAQVTLPSAAPVVLRAPDTILVAARLLLPEGVSGADLALSPSFALPGEFGHLRHALWSTERHYWHADAEGRLAPERLPRGRHPFSLMRRGDSDSYSGVLTVELEATEDGEVELDLRESFPVPVNLVVEVPEALGGRIRWLLRATGDGRSVGFSGRITLDGPPPPLTAHASPGTYTLHASGPGFEWTAPAPVVIAREGAAKLTAALPLIPRVVRLIDGEGQPRKQTLFAYWTATGARAVAATDESGAAELCLLAGEASFALPPPTPAELDPPRRTGRAATPRVPPDVLNALTAAATLPWGAGEGPLELRL